MKNYLTQNAKMKKSTGKKTFNWGIPAFKAESGFKTCPMADECAKGCYATQGAYIWSNVKPAFERRLALTKDASFIATLDAEIKRRKIERVRIHDSGDFYSPKYLKAWLEIMRLNPTVEFYAYTKMIKVFKALKSEFPSNFTYIFSYGGKQDALINPEKDRHSQVFGSIDDLQSEGYIDATNDDSLALTEDPKIGLVYHGAKSKKWGN
jgi:hypothetical protein